MCLAADDRRRARWGALVAMGVVVMVAASEAPPVVVEDPDAVGMAQVMESLMAKAASRKPALARRTRGSLTLLTTDYPAAATVRFEQRRIVVSNTADERAWLAIEGEALALVELSGGLGLRAMRARGVRLRGIGRHPLFALRVRRLLAAANPRA